jgi:20S proteasome alpha/beta subunit
LTLILAIRAKDGIVMASDGQATEVGGDQPTKLTTQTIFPVHKNALWGGAGDGGAIDEVKLLIDALQPSKAGNHSTLCEAFTEKIFQVNHPRWERFRKMGLPSSKDPTATALMVQYEGDVPHIVEFEIHGAACKYDKHGYQAIGSGSNLARPWLREYYTNDVDLDQARTLGYMTVQRVIETAALGVGPPIDVWTLRKKSGSLIIEQASEESKNGLKDAVNVISQLQKEVFTAYKIDRDKAAINAP